MKELKVTIAFNTTNNLNKITETQQVEQISNVLTVKGVDGVTLNENLGGYIRQDNGKNDIEYSYTFIIFESVTSTMESILNHFEALGKDNNQESIIFDNDLIEL